MKAITFIILWISILLVYTSFLVAQVDHNQPPINYDSKTPKDRVAGLVQKLESGESKLRWDDNFGWLPDILRKLDIAPSTQTLVFSRTSQQHRKIRPSSPRAIYFNDDSYVGYVRSGDFLEIAAVDPDLGAVFYTLDQKKSDSVLFNRDSINCLACHESHKTQGVPGFLVRSVYPKSNGHPDFRFGTTHTDHRTPFSDRFGGWYVTGNHGKMRHRGNVVVKSDAENAESAIDCDAGANLAELPKIAMANSYLKPTSDIVALMVLEHQTQFHNYVTKANYETRRALHYQSEMNELFERDKEFQSDTTKRRIQAVADKLVEYLFFCNEFELTNPIQGHAEFEQVFRSSSIRDSKGRSLRDLDLQKRLLKYPCSYLIYSDSFKALHPAAGKAVKDGVIAVLTGQNHSEKFSHLQDNTRKVILEILSDTHPWFQNKLRN